MPVRYMAAMSSVMRSSYRVLWGEPGLKIAIAVSRDPDLHISYALDTKGPGIAPIAIISRSLFSLVLLSSYMVGEFFTHKIRKKGSHLFLDAHANVLNELDRDILYFLINASALIRLSSVPWMFLLPKIR